MYGFSHPKHATVTILSVARHPLIDLDQVTSKGLRSHLAGVTLSHCHIGLTQCENLDQSQSVRLDTRSNYKKGDRGRQCLKLEFTGAAGKAL